jgi:uncharacterized radical SAM superfamily Fe-S cluster-containing enzyme
MGFSRERRLCQCCEYPASACPEAAETVEPPVWRQAGNIEMAKTYWSMT